MILRILLGIWMAAVIAGAFLLAPPAETLGELARIFYFHVPMAWISGVAFLWSMVQSVIYLAKQKPANDVAAESAARIGLIFCLLATGSGMVFAKATWGAYWNWDPRETSIFVLLLIYLAYLALRMAVEEPERRARYAAVYSILAFFSVPFLMLILPRLTFTLHPSPIINNSGKMLVDPEMKLVFFASLAGFTALYVWIQNLSVRIGMLARREEEE